MTIDTAAPTAASEKAPTEPFQQNWWEKENWGGVTNTPKNTECNTITPRYNEIFRWAGALTTEQGEEPDYLETRDVQILKNRLTRLKGQLIVALGLQGVGKTALRQHLANELDDTLSLKWTSPREFVRVLAEARKDEKPLDREGYGSLLFQALNRRLGFMGLPSKARYVAKLLGMGLDTEQTPFDKIYDWQVHRLNPQDLEALQDDMLKKVIPAVEAYLPPRDLARVEAAFTKAAVSRLNTLLIDFPDYDRRTRTQALKDLKDFQAFWEGTNFTPGEGYNIADSTPNLVLFWQAETWQSDHFLQGKFQRFKLQPFTADDLVTFYINKFGDTQPFTEEALHAVAALSRGIFRWFKKYVGLCLDNYLIDQPETITPTNVERWVPVSQIAEDMNRELVMIFPRSKKLRKRTVIVLQYLREHGRTAQRDLAQRFFGPDRAAEMTTCRFLSKLEDAGYITRDLEGRNAFIALTEEGS